MDTRKYVKISFKPKCSTLYWQRNLSH